MPAASVSRAQAEALIAGVVATIAAERAQQGRNGSPSVRALRPAQIAPAGDWRTWMIMTGRGWGKNLAASSDGARYALANPGARIAVVAPTYADARDTCVEGDSGILSALPRSAITTWNRSLGELVLTNGSRFKLFSADEPERLRGPQHHRALCDEVGAWRYAAAWDMLQFGLRLGDDPRAIVTTTPKPTKLIRMLAESPSTIITRGSTYENIDNLPAAYRDQILSRYEGTRLGRQEIHGEILTDVPGALWRYEDIHHIITDSRITSAEIAEHVRGGRLSGESAR